MGQILCFEDFNDFLPKFGVNVGFLGLLFREMNADEIINLSHYMLPFRDSSDGKVILHLLNPKLDIDLTSGYEFRYAAGNSYASGPALMS